MRDFQNCSLRLVSLQRDVWSVFPVRYRLLLFRCPSCAPAVCCSYQKQGFLGTVLTLASASGTQAMLQFLSNEVTT